jgi:murein DD-endopeptidase MepM/ murein hydrolase activator NlpD
VFRTIGCLTIVVCMALAGAAAVAGRAIGAQPHAGWVKPVDGARVSQPFGCTSAPFEPVDRACAGGHWHSGVDLAAPRGAPVRASLDGVASVFRSATGYGLHVVIDHGGGLVTLYAHLESAVVTDGSALEAGDVVGAVGSSGNSTGPHLHFEVRRDGIAEDPLLDLRLP